MSVLIGRVRYALPGIVCLALLALTNTALSKEIAESPKPDGNGLGAANLVGKQAPYFEATTLDGKPVSLANFNGKVVLLNFWATWCGACKLEMPWFAQLREQYAKDGFEILGVVTDDASDEKIRRIAETYGVRYPILHCNHKTAQAYGGLPYLPESIYIDRVGRVELAVPDADSKAAIEANIKRLLSGRAR